MSPNMISSNKVHKLRELMQKYSIHGYIVPSGDAHLSEYISDADKRREFISGFDGSAGTAVVTMEEASLFTDGRYWLQAQQQLDPAIWKLMKLGIDPPLSKYITSFADIKRTTTFGVDPFLFSVNEFLELRKAASESEKGQVEIKPILENLLEEKYTGRSVADKLKFVRTKMEELGGACYVLTALDEIAWILNLRGSDIDYNTVFISYMIVTSQDAYLYVDESKFESPNIKNELSENNIHVKPYLQYMEDLKTITEKVQNENSCLIDPRTCNFATFEAIRCKVKKIHSIITAEKAIKNAVEREGFKSCHIRDGAAIVKYLAWLENELENGRKVNEYDGALALEKFRKENTDFLRLSFSTISAYGKSASVVHYSPPETNSEEISTDNLYLLDSGAHYKDGTTDTTRTVHFGTPSDYQKRCFTRVLQGHIALDRLVFPEGPHGIGYRSLILNEFGMKENCIVTNEPGYYEPGKFGIRIENILLTKGVDTMSNFNDKKYLGFESVTRCPIQPNLVDTNLLARDEIEWINNYNGLVREALAPLLQNNDLALKYLLKHTEPISL
ncbi:hypothetical protein C9374_004153 [Naegleria lovaniensis]|uniref:Uncharacterized protein n=1 Tax=Naegleria lovaniensis TaxID=51637 RepID=A0AA88GSD7_NAELO|nr:uncharacterized protein C9374_004153 [Naegleria lovaniensis]KAG2383482.1 hypothetical protein C9374_004153 [Naegleria lovaniensis]